MYRSEITICFSATIPLLWLKPRERPDKVRQLSGREIAEGECLATSLASLAGFLFPQAAITPLSP